MKYRMHFPGWSRRIFILVGLLVLFFAGLSIRRTVLEANYSLMSDPIPFTLESALQFRSVESIYRDGSLPQTDLAVEYPGGIRIKETDTVMAEYVYARLARWLPASMSLTERVRWITAAWFCLTIPLMAVWVTGWTGSKRAGLLAGLLYAGSLSSVIRSTGQELSRENFAMPFLLLHLAASVWSVRATEARSRLFLNVIAGASLGMAMATWDMIQYYVILLAIVWAVRIWSGSSLMKNYTESLFFLVGGLVVTGVINPYLRAHGFLFSPAMLVLYSAITVVLWEQTKNKPAPLGFKAIVFVLPWLVMLLAADRYMDSYSHFGELLIAKIRHLNQKPVDPSLLTFAQRIMWVPALDSATWSLTKILFPGSLYISLVAIWLAALGKWRAGKRHPDVQPSENIPYIFYFVVSIFSFVLFVRFHVYVAIFASAWTAWLLAWSLKRKAWVTWSVGVLVLLTVYIEWNHVLKEPARWGRPNVYYQELMELTDWLKEHVAPEPVLANFGVSAAILTYGHCPIILHPKFETRHIRERVQAYGEALFKGDEEAFRDWADQYGARYYVHAVGEFASIHPELQMRYFVDALSPPEDAAARMFEFKPDSAVYFDFLWGNRKYRVFQVISRADEEKADLLTIYAERALRESRFDEAEEAAWNALTLFPSHIRAREVIARVSAVRDLLEEQP